MFTLTEISNAILQQPAAFGPAAVIGLTACLAGAVVLGISVLMLSRKKSGQ